MEDIGQHFVIGFEGTKVTPVVRKLITKYNVGGVILFGRNIENTRQVRRLNDQLQKTAGGNLLIGVDQEGGLVARLRDPLTIIPPMVHVGDYLDRTKNSRTITALGRMMGRELRTLGFNWDFAPVVDVHSNPKNPVIGNRSFGPDPVDVARCAEALMRGLHAEGILSCVKHFPGHGMTSVDSHKDLPIVRALGRLLWKRDISPYRRLIPKGVVKTIMTAHVRYKDLDSSIATLSRYILTDILRKRLRFNGLIVSDDLFMKAVYDRYPVPECGRLFFKAGGDIALVCRHPEVAIEAIEAVKKAAQEDTFLRKHFSQSLRRIRRIKQRFCQPAPSFDPSVIGCSEHRKVVEKILSGK